MQGRPSRPEHTDRNWTHDVELHDLVVEYADLGVHRTGTDVDQRTIEWFSAQLAARGFATTQAPFGFERYDTQVEVSLDGEPIEADARFYGPSGVFDATVTVVDVPVDRAWLGDGDTECIRPDHDGHVVVCRTVGQVGDIAMPNRLPLRSDGPFVALVAPRDVPSGAKVRVRARAGRVPARSATVVGRSGPRTDRPLIVTTPLSGWYRCAAERGTGIAALLHLVSHLPPEVDVVVVATTGHELHHLGLVNWLRSTDVVPRGVLHLGASVGACEPASSPGDDPLPSPARVVFHRTASEAVIAPLVDQGFRTVHNPPDWLGEGRNWSQLEAPLVSVTGGFSRFHTASDLPLVSTDPRVLDRVSAAVVDVAHRLLETC